MGHNESSKNLWSTGEDKGKPLQYSFPENPRTVWKGKKMKREDEHSPSW